MVQFFNLGQSASGKLAESLGKSLGEGLGDFLGNYGAAKKMQNILNDSKLKNKSPAERLEALVVGLAPHGDFGAKRLTEALQIEQLTMQEKREKENTRLIESTQKKLVDPNLTLEEKTNLISQLPKEAQAPYIPFIKEMAKRQTQLQNQNQRANILGLAPQTSAQPIPAPSLNIEEGDGGVEAMQGQKVGQQAGGVPQQQIPSQQVPQVGFKLPYSQQQIQNALIAGDQQLARNMISENKIAATQNENLRKEQIEFHKEGAKYDEDLRKHTKAAKSQIEAIGTIRKAVSSGNVKPQNLANVLKSFGSIGNRVAEAMLNEDQAALVASIPQLLEGWKEVFGVRLSDADLRLLQDKLPSLGKTPEANKTILKIMEKYADQTVLRSKIASEIKKQNNGLRPIDYAEQVEERFDKMIKPVKIRNPNTGNVIEIPSYKVSPYIEAGGEVVNE